MFLSLQFLSSANISEQGVRHSEHNIAKSKPHITCASELSWIMLSEENKFWKNNPQLKYSVDWSSLKITTNNAATVIVQPCGTKFLSYNNKNEGYRWKGFL